MPLFRRSNRPDNATYVVSGFASLMDYDAREPSWEADRAFDDVEAATEAARAWLAEQNADAQVEAIREQGREGVVVRVVSQAGVDEI
jgi:hypothetical protein